MRTSERRGVAQNTGQQTILTTREAVRLKRSTSGVKDAALADDGPEMDKSRERYNENLRKWG